MNEEVFGTWVRIAVDRGDDAVRELATAFEIGVGTVRRWADGVACPHPQLRERVVDYIKTYMR